MISYIISMNNTGWRECTVYVCVCMCVSALVGANAQCSSQEDTSHVMGGRCQAAGDLDELCQVV